MSKTLRPVWLIARREIRDQFRDWRIILPIIILVLFFPFLMHLVARQILSFVAQYEANLVAERFIPFLLMIVGFFPISVSLVMALESFVGEKERGSIEPLLHTPILDWQIYFGKVLSALILPLFGSFLGMSIYGIGLRAIGVALPEIPMLILIVSLTVVQAFAMVSGAVVLSSQATSVRAANLLASFIIIPFALLIQVEAVMMFWGRDIDLLWWMVLGLLILALLLTRIGLVHFKREELLGRDIDSLNIRKAGKIFCHIFTGGASNPLQWYRRVLPVTIYKMRWSIVIVGVLATFGLAVGAQHAEQFTLPFDRQYLVSGLSNVNRYIPVLGESPVLAIWWQNLRAQILGLLLGLFSFGILGILPIVATMSIVGYILGVFSLNGVSPVLLVTGLILPHGIIEIPGVILANAAVLQLGVMMATPTPGKTFSDVLLASVARWLQVTIGFVAPMLLISAAVEAWVTPHVAVWLFQ